MKDFSEGFTVIDIETTGLSPGSNEIIELSAVRFENFAPAESFTTLVKPRRGINYQAYLINGISEEMVKGAPFIEEVREDFLGFLAEEVFIVGHNIRFDLGFLKSSGIRLDDSKYIFHDTMYIARKHLRRGKVKNHRLDTLCSHFKIDYQCAHRGVSDCIATGHLFCRLNDY